MKVFFRRLAIFAEVHGVSWTFVFYVNYCWLNDIEVTTLALATI